jgi:hypothetical protein
VNDPHQGKDPSIIFQTKSHATPRPLAPPEYRQQALRYVIGVNKEKGLSSLSFSELALELRDQNLRKEVDPSFEPLSLESINAAVADLVQTREITVSGRTVVFP